MSKTRRSSLKSPNLSESRRKLSGCRCGNDTDTDNNVEQSIVEVLQNELETLKVQLAKMATNKIQMLNITNELQQKYNNLLSHKNCLETEIDNLRIQNTNLINELNKYKKVNQDYLIKVQKTKQILDEYEKNLNELFQQFVEHSKVVEISKRQFTKFINKKNTNLKNLSEMNESLTRKIRCKDIMYEQLNKSYEQLKTDFENTTNALKMQEISSIKFENKRNPDASSGNKKTVKIRDKDYLKVPSPLFKKRVRGIGSQSSMKQKSISTACKCDGKCPFLDDINTKLDCPCDPCPFDDEDDSESELSDNETNNQKEKFKTNVKKTNSDDRNNNNLNVNEGKSTKFQKEEKKSPPVPQPIPKIIITAPNEHEKLVDFVDNLTNLVESNKDLLEKISSEHLQNSSGSKSKISKLCYKSKKVDKNSSDDVSKAVIALQQKLDELKRSLNGFTRNV